MKTLGWIFLIAYLVDAVVSTVANFVVDVVPVSSAISTGMMVFAALVFVLSAVGTLQPKKVFLTLTLYYYAVLVVFGVVMISLLISKIGIEEFVRIGSSANSGSRLFRSHFPWFDAVHLPILIVWLLLAVYGLVAFGKRNKQTAEERIEHKSEQPV